MEHNVLQRGKGKSITDLFSKEKKVSLAPTSSPVPWIYIRDVYIGVCATLLCPVSLFLDMGNWE